MKTEEINKKINAKIAEINSNYPELAKYLAEMPITLPDEKNPEVTNAKLYDYYNSLEQLIKNYAVTHQKK